MLTEVNGSPKTLGFAFAGRVFWSRSKAERVGLLNLPFTRFKIFFLIFNSNNNAKLYRRSATMSTTPKTLEVKIRPYSVPNSERPDLKGGMQTS